MRLSVAILLSSLAFLPPVFGADLDDPVRKAVDEAVVRVKPAIVQIMVVETACSQGREIKGEAAGSGAIISRDGLVITNHHVAGDAVRLACILPDKEEIPAILVGTDPMTDIAILRLAPEKPREFPAAVFGDSDALRVGDRVLAMGSPLSLSQSVTMGIVSNTTMTLPRMAWAGQFLMDGEDVAALVRWIGHDAAIFHGNSGGPLVNLRGEIVGVNELGIGLGGAIPANLARKVADALITKGRVSRAWLGLEVQPLLKSSGRPGGILVSGTSENSPARAAGFAPGDILVKLAGQPVEARFSEQVPLFNQAVAALPVDKPAEAVILRGGVEKTLTVTPIEREKSLPKAREFKEWGLTARNLSALAMRELKRETCDGAFITSLRPGGPAAEAKPALQPGDVITAVNGAPVKNVEELAAATEKIVAGKTEPVPTLVAFDRKAPKLLSVARVGLPNLADPGLEVKKAWLPAATQVITREMAKALGIPEKTGVRVTQVYPGNTAEKAGLAVGDLIVSLDGNAIPASQPEDEEVFPNMIRQYAIGAVAELTALRGAEEKKIPVELVRAPRLAREMKKYRDENFEFTGRDTAFFDKTENRWETEAQGVYVEEVKSGGWAALGRLSVGDLITTVGPDTVTDVVSLEKAMTRVATEKPHRLVLSVRRGIHTLYVEIETQWK
ncbi:MAG: PDZ domain-containing protein [Planctomycetota bacterium]